ncbi:hypothetical protein GX50_03270 [[Emmonsia] crescens]|uniref:BED-type domain-containing protein n=1 Tax=[Emmonsia] crescens TaxID=73230 RepID=A0A2B7ZKL2_9EURO|nr:hypothetical protein GX50_03270 [Emmonsia crescens]
MSTRKKRQLGYYVLNGGSDEEAENSSFENLPGSEITPAESVSQILPQSTVSLPNSQVLHQKRQKPFRVTVWLWKHFEVTTVSHPWKSRTGKEYSTDRDIKCKYCSWNPSDSIRQTSTGNMLRHTTIEPLYSSRFLMIFLEFPFHLPPE